MARRERFLAEAKELVSTGMRRAAPGAATCRVPPCFLIAWITRNVIFVLSWLSHGSWRRGQGGVSPPPRRALPVLAGRRGCAGTCGCTQQPGTRLAELSVCLLFARGLSQALGFAGEKLRFGGKQPQGVGLLLGLRVGGAAALLEHRVPHPVPVDARAKLGPCHAPEWVLSPGSGG